MHRQSKCFLTRKQVLNFFYGVALVGAASFSAALRSQGLCASVARASQVWNLANAQPKASHWSLALGGGAWKLLFPAWTYPEKARAMKIFYFRKGQEELSQSERVFLEKKGILEDFRRFRSALLSHPGLSQSMVLKELIKEGGKSALWAYALLLFYGHPEPQVEAQESLMSSGGSQEEADLIFFEEHDEAFVIQGDYAYELSPQGTKKFHLSEVKQLNWGRFQSAAHIKLRLTAKGKESSPTIVELLDHWVSRQYLPPSAIWSEYTVVNEVLKRTGNKLQIPTIAQGGHNSLLLYLRHLSYLGQGDFSAFVSGVP